MSMDTDSSNTLPDGFQLGEFTLVKRIGEGGFSIVYLAKDNSLDRMVAIKEYMPSSLASRSVDLTVSVKSDRYLDTFNAGMKSFINEAKLLGQFDQASVVKVYRFFESNSTAYMVMPFYEGRTLKQVLKDMGGPPDEAWLRTLLSPVMDALELIHSYQCFHRDIAPDNIMILGDGRPLLIDFGAARRVIGDMTQALTAILKPGFAPIEQYADIPGIRQGAWTDVYALAGVIYYALVGKAPVPSVARVVTDSLVPLSTQLAGKYSDQFLRAIDSALKVRPEDRIQSASEFRTALGLDSEFRPSTVDLSGAGFDKTTTTSHGEFLPTNPVSRTGSKMPVASPQTVPPPVQTAPQKTAHFSQIEATSQLPPRQPESFGAVPPPVSPTPAAALAKPSKTPLFAGVGAAIAALAAGVWWFAQSPTTKPDTKLAGSKIEDSKSSAPVTAEPSPKDKAPKADVPAAPAASSSPAVPAPAPSPSAGSTPSAGPATSGGPSIDGLPDAQKFIQTLEARASKEAVLKVNMSNQTLVIGKDQLKFTVSANQPGFLYVFMAGTAGELTQLFPNGIHTDNKLEPGTEMLIPPGSKYSFTAGGPAGKDTLLVMLSKAKRDFSEAGSRKIGEFSAFDFQKMNQKLSGAGPEILIGKPECEAAAADCRNYWVSKLEVLEVKANKPPPPKRVAPAPAVPKY